MIEELVEPQQPAECEWRFVEDLQSPMWTQHHWNAREPRTNKISLATGVRIEAGFPDSQNALETAYDDLRNFLRAGNISLDGEFVIETQRIETEIPETFQIKVLAGRCSILAGDTEGIRRGIFHIEDEMLRAGGAFLPAGEITRTPVIRTRISRCFFGPIKRPPKNRDELADDVNYYPDEYLNRLAHDGVNALWLSAKFRDLCPSRFFPGHGTDAPRRLEKLRQTVRRCARYGIKIYVFCIEPMAFGINADHTTPMHYLDAHPELAGHSPGSSLKYFCTSTQSSQQYLEEVTFDLFNAVPGLGGLIDINLGERPTHCYSGLTSFETNNCPNCSKRAPWEVFADTVSALARGMQKANPQAEMVSWLYVPYMAETPEADFERDKKFIAQVASHVPHNVTVQVNFESNGMTEQCGQTHTVRDYSLAWVGTSELFADCATGAVKNGGKVSAKLQVGCSHEVATVPVVPVPGNIYRKYKIMHELGVSAAMQCWYFGNYPSVNTKAAGMLSFAPFPETEDEFLHQLAGINWGGDTDTVTQAYEYFRDAYSQFPSALQFSWFGPVHDSIAWPLHLIPVDRTISPSWLLGWPVSGDRVPECFANEFTWDEILSICRRMSEQWNQGVQLLEKIKPRYENQPDRLLDIGVAQALNLQLKSAWNVMRFYALREALPHQSVSQQLHSLEALREIVEEEIENSRRLMTLSKADSRLGFHSEAEGYKYFPEKLSWRINLLENVLQTDFPSVERQIQNGEALFPTYTGAAPEGEVYRAAIAGKFDAANPLTWQECPVARCEEITPADAQPDAAQWATSWQAAADEKQLYLRVACQSPASTLGQAASSGHLYSDEYVVVSIEPRRLWPTQQFFASVHGQTHHEDKSTLPSPPWQATLQHNADGWEVLFAIPWNYLRQGEPFDRPMRINVERSIPNFGKSGWLRRHPLPSRLVFSIDNPADYGWLLFN